MPINPGRPPITKSTLLPWTRDMHRGAFAAGCVAAIGAFDGLHLGHQAVLAVARAHANRLGLPLLVICFEPLPRIYFRQPELFSLQAPSARIRSLINECDRVLMLRFNERLAQMSAAEFVEDLLISALKVKALFVGDDFRFGHKRQGDVALLHSYADHFQVHTLKSIRADELRISASRIRQCLRTQDVRAVLPLLGRPYRFSGRVQHGQKLGRTLGFPTANFAFPEANPLRGIFAVRVSGAGLHQHPAVASVGHRPAVKAGDLWLEVHLFDYLGDLYGKKLDIDFIEFMRAEANFDSLESLTAQIAADCLHARRLLSSSKES